jgi:hypothetical protein
MVNESPEACVAWPQISVELSLSSGPDEKSCLL